MISFGNRIEMLVDDYLLEKTENVSFRKAEPKALGKVLGFDEPWEGLGSLGLTIFEDDENIKCYYRGFPNGASDQDERQTSCLAVSKDGIRFARVPINRISYDGITENNILRMDTYCHNFAPFYDANPACRPEERYKAIGGKWEEGGVHVFGSPDGICWHEMADGPVITKGAFDSMNMAFWNPHTGLYHAYTRYFDKTMKSEVMPMGCRGIQSCTSEDFVHWTEPVYNEYAEGSPTDQLYTNATRPVPGAEHILVSIPMRFQEKRKKITDYEGNPYGAGGVSDCVLMTSRDGVHWNRTFPEAWIAPGLHQNEWTHRSFIALSGIIERGDDFYIYMMQNYVCDDDGIWCYSVPRYRFASVYAGYFGGSFTTKPLHFETDTFYMNYSTAAYGDVQVTVYDADGNVLGVTDKIYGNELSRPLTFDGIAGRDGYLKITLRDAHVYALGGKMTK